MSFVHGIYKSLKSGSALKPKQIGYIKKITDFVPSANILAELIKEEFRVHLNGTYSTKIEVIADLAKKTDEEAFTKIISELNEEEKSRGNFFKSKRVKLEQKADLKFLKYLESTEGRKRINEVFNSLFTNFGRELDECPAKINIRNFKDDNKPVTLLIFEYPKKQNQKLWYGKHKIFSIHSRISLSINKENGEIRVRRKDLGKKEMEKVKEVIKSELKIESFTPEKIAPQSEEVRQILSKGADGTCPITKIKFTSKDVELKEVTIKGENALKKFIEIVGENTYKKLQDNLSIETLSNEIGEYDLK